MSYELASWKARYFDKVLSYNAEYVNWLRSLDTGRYFMDYAWSLVFQFNTAVLSFTISFDLPPIDLEPFNLDFKVELPDWSKLLQGILIDIQRLRFDVEWPWTISVEDFLEANIEEPFIKPIEETRPKKAIYGQSRYDESIYDPPAIREFIRSTLAKIYQRRVTMTTVLEEVKNLRDTLNLNPHVAHHLFTHLDMIVRAQTESFILGYSVLGKSKLARRASDEALFPFIDLEGRPYEAKAMNLAHLQHGFILGISCLGLGVLMPRQDIYTKPTKPSPTGYIVPSSPPFIELMLRKVLRLRDTYTLTTYALANYQRPEERQAFYRSQRADIYHSLMALRRHIEDLVASILRGRDVDLFKARMYKMAAQQLIGHPAKRHMWGFKAYQAMSEEELKEWWIKHWTAQGLDPSILEEIYRIVSRFAIAVRRSKLALGERLRRERYGMAVLARR